MMLCSWCSPDRKQAEPFVNRYVVREDCQFCHAGDAICSRWGYDAVSRSRCYTGSARALDAFVSRLRPGADLSVGVIGGSISACHDVELPECYHSLFARELEREHGVTITVHNGGLGAVGSQFFAACWNLMLTGEEDLIILELAVNDPPYQLINKSMAYLILTLLSLPKRPALLLLDLYSPNYDFWYDAGVSTNTLAQFYDLPVIRCASAPLLRRGGCR